MARYVVQPDDDASASSSKEARLHLQRIPGVQVLDEAPGGLLIEVPEGVQIEGRAPPGWTIHPTAEVPRPRTRPAVRAPRSRSHKPRP
jgi:hypothetical protein